MPEQFTWIVDIERILRITARGQSPVVLRSATFQDKSDLAELYFAAYSRDVVSTMGAAQKEMDLMFHGEYGELDLASSPVKSSLRGIAAAVMTVHDAPWPDTPPGPFIIEVMVRPDYRRRGLAENCIIAAASELHAHNKRSVALRVMSDNEGALALYRGLGFSTWNGS